MFSFVFSWFASNPLLAIVLIIAGLVVLALIAKVAGKALLVIALVVVILFALGVL